MLLSREHAELREEGASPTHTTAGLGQWRTPWEQAPPRYLLRVTGVSTLGYQVNMVKKGVWLFRNTLAVWIVLFLHCKVSLDNFSEGRYINGTTA